MEVRDVMPAKKDPARRKEWEAVESLARGLIAETRFHLCGGYLVPVV